MPVFNNALAGAAGSGGAAAYEIERSLRFNSEDSAYLNRTPSSAGSRTTWTWSGWVKRANSDSDHHLFVGDKAPGASLSDTTFGRFYILSTGQLDLSGYTTVYRRTNALLRDPSAWYHLVVAVDTTQSTDDDRIKLYINGSQVPNTDFATKNNPSPSADLGFNQTTPHTIGARSRSGTIAFHLDGYLADVHFIDGQALAATDFGEFDADTGVWNPIKYTGTYGTNGFHLDFSDNSSNAALGYDAAGSNDWDVNNISGPGGDYDYASMVTQGSDGGYNSGSEADTAFDGSLTTAPNTSAGNNNGNITFTPSPSISHTTSVRAYWKWGNSGATYSYNGGSDTSITASGWITLASGSGTFTSLNTDRDGDGNYFSAIEIDGSILINSTGADNDSLIDTPTNYEADSGNNGGNYATFNPLNHNTHSAYYTLSNGNLKCVAVGGSSQSSGSRGFCVSTLGMSSGKYYFELTVDLDDNNDHAVGIATAAGTGYYSTAGNWTYAASGNKFANSGSGASYGASYGNGDTIGVAFDADTGALVFYKNGSSQGTLATVTTGETYFFVWGTDAGTAQDYEVTANFGQRPFAYTPPTGHVSLCTQNLDESAYASIADGSTAMDVNTYSSDGTTNKKISTNFAPDFAWFKIFSQSGQWHLLADYVRGGNKTLSTNNTNTEVTRPGFVNFDSDGLTVGDGNSNPSTVVTLVNYAWDAGDSNTSISAGGLNSSVYDQTTTWSSLMSGHSQNAASAFDGNGTTYAQANSGATITIDLSTYSITATSRLQVLNDPAFTGSTDVQYKIYTTSSSTPAFTKTIGGTESFDEASSNWSSAAITKITVRGLNEGARISKVIYDGKTLVDDTVTPTNVPSIATTYRANPSAGFSIVSYTGNGTAGATVGHGLNAVPEWVVCKDRDDGDNWQIYHAGAQTSGAQLLTFTLASATSNNGPWNNTAPNSSVITLGGGGTNDTGNNHIMYCWTSVPGFSSFGSYVATGLTDGPFVFTGMRPKFILAKITSGNTDDWIVYDTERSPFNAADDEIYPNGTSGEVSGSRPVDILSNGFKIRNNSNKWNGAAGYVYIYAAFAENPFKYARAR